MTWSLLNGVLAPDVKSILDKIDEGNEGRPDMDNRAMPREKAECIIHACLWAYSCRSGDFAGAYAMEAFRKSVGRETAEWIVRMDDFDKKGAELCKS